ncbi:MAG TPA: hypothetical protein VFP12_14675 [Allosphingosinicella sp.]|nr:hypothetical protein [Allosphingosinicella sp.]
MRKFETWLTGLLWVAVALLLPVAALEPVSVAGVHAATGGFAVDSCDDGSAHLAMGCASILL